MGQRDPDGPVWLFDCVGERHAGDGEAHRRQERRNAGREEPPQQTPPLWRATGDGRLTRARRRRDDRAHVPPRRDLIHRPHVRAANRICEGRVEVGLIGGRHGNR